MGAYDVPTSVCPYCKTVCDADWCDVGVGMVQCGPYHCLNCGASEIGPYDKERPLTSFESHYGWYAPGTAPGSSANVIDGKIVSHRIMRDTYKREFTGNPLYDAPGYVANWWEKIRG